MAGNPHRFTAAEIHDRRGQRKYLTGAERRRFRATAETLEPPRKTFCLMLLYTGARISEVLELSPERIDFGDKAVVIRTLKRRRDNVFRAVPLPGDFLTEMRRLPKSSGDCARIWSFSRKTAYRIVKQAMRDSGIKGLHASPKGLRHGFGVTCVRENVPLPTIAKWMGHCSLETTAIYLNVIGKEERGFARRTWK